MSIKCRFQGLDRFFCTGIQRVHLNTSSEHQNYFIIGKKLKILFCCTGTISEYYKRGIIVYSQLSHRAEIVVGPWLVNTGSEVGPPPPPTPDDGRSSAAASDLRLPAVGDVGAEPALDRLPTPPTDTAPVTGGTMQDRRFLGVCAPPPRENRRPDSALSLLHSPVVGVASGLVEAGERAYTGTAEKCSSGMRIRPEHLAHTCRQQRAQRTPQLNRVKRVRMHRKHTCNTNTGSYLLPARRQETGDDQEEGKEFF